MPRLKKASRPRRKVRKTSRRMSTGRGRRLYVPRNLSSGARFTEIFLTNNNQLLSATTN